MVHLDHQHDEAPVFQAAKQAVIFHAIAPQAFHSATKWFPEQTRIGGAANSPVQILDHFRGHGGPKSPERSKGVGAQFIIPIHEWLPLDCKP